MADKFAGVEILDCTAHRQLWRSWFRDPDSWAPWRVFLSGLFGLPLDTEQLALFKECAGLDAPAPGGYDEVWVIAGRRSGKSFILALTAVFLACFRDWRPYLAPGEAGTFKIIAVDRKQAGVIHRYCRALIQGVPALNALVVRETDDVIELNNRIILEIQSANFRSTRGFTLIAALCDELAFWKSDEGAANPHSEIIAALRPAMSTIPHAKLLCASSPYARRGALWDSYRAWYGKPGGPLVWRAATRTMNPTISEAFIAGEVERDPASAAAEYFAQFRSDIETFIPREVVDAATIGGRFELPPMAMRYVAFVDP